MIPLHPHAIPAQSLLPRDVALGSPVPLQSELVGNMPAPSLGPEPLSANNSIVGRITLGHLETKEPHPDSHTRINWSQSSLASHGLSGRAVVVHCYTSTSLHAETGEFVPPQLAPFPHTDAYLTNYARIFSGEGDTVLTLPAAPDLNVYHRSHGLHARGMKIIEMNPGPKLGFPDTCQLTRALDERITFEDDRYLVATLPTEYTRQVGLRLGLNVHQTSDSAIAGDKVLFRAAAHRFDFPVFDGRVLRTASDIEDVVATFGSSSYGGVLKLAHGAGGDTVRFLPPHFTESDVIGELAEFRALVEKAFSAGDFGPAALEHYWPKHSPFPAHSAIFFEQHARDLGEVLINGSNTIIIGNDGTIEVPHYYEQITHNGAFIGSRPVFFKDGVKKILDREMRKIAAFCRDELKLFGVVGVDFMIIRTPQNELQVYFYELNPRPSSSAAAQIVADKLGAKHFIQTSVEHCSAEINTIADAREVLRGLPENYFDGAEDGSRVVVSCLKSLWTLDGETRSLIRPSRSMKILITGPSQERCRQILDQLPSIGLRVG